MECDAAEALCLALGGHHAATDIEAFQAGVGLGLKAHHGPQQERPAWRIQQGQPCRRMAVELGRQRLAIKADLQQFQIDPCQLQGRRGSSGRRL